MSDNTKRLLLVEDNQIDIEAVQRSLSKSELRLEIESVESLSSAISSLDSKNFDVVVLDLGLPDSAGVESVRRISESFSHIPIVVLTAWDEVFGAKVIGAGANEYLSKSNIGNGGLSQAVAQALGKASLENVSASISEQDNLSPSSRSHLLELTAELRRCCSDLVLDNAQLSCIAEIQEIAHISNKIAEQVTENI